MKYYFIVLCVVVILFVIAFILVNKATKKAKEKKEKEESEKQEKIKKETEFIKNVKESSIVNNWADEISEYIASFLNDYPYRGIEFHFRGCAENLEFGMNLQSVWSPIFKKFISQDRRRSIKTYIFYQYGLPNLNSSGNQIELFSVAVAEVVADKLKKQGYCVMAGKIEKFVNSEGYRVAGYNSCFGKIICSPPKIQGEW